MAIRPDGGDGFLTTENLCQILVGWDAPGTFPGKCPNDVPETQPLIGLIVDCIHRQLTYFGAGPPKLRNGTGQLASV